MFQPVFFFLAEFMVRKGFRFHEGFAREILEALFSSRRKSPQNGSLSQNGLSQNGSPEMSLNVNISRIFAQLYERAAVW